MYVIKRLDQGGGYVTPPGSRGSYTRNLAEARTFYTRDAAQAECCPENETPVSVDDIMQKPRP